MAGRRRKSKTLRLIGGNAGKRPIPENEPEPTAGRPTRPAFLGKDGKSEWECLAQLLEDERRLTLSDGPMLSGAATAYESALTIRKKLKGRGMPPELWLRTKTAERMQWETYRKFCNDLCLSAGTRAKASVANRPKTSKADAFQARKVSATTRHNSASSK